MPDLGEVDRDVFETSVSPNRGADRADVSLEPQHGGEFGIVDVGDGAVAIATDPMFLLPSLGLERAAWFAVHGLLSTVAVSGIAPTHLAVDFNLPPAMTDEQFATVWETFDREATELGVAIVTGHTGRYEGCTYPMVGGGTAMAVAHSEGFVRPDGAQVGDRVVVTNGPAIGATALLATGFESRLREDVGAAGTSIDDAVDAAMDRFYDTSSVHDALTAAAAGHVNAMHGATASGVYGGLVEMARAANVRIEIERDAVPIQPGVLPTCDCFGIDPWIARSEGTLLAAVDPSGVEDVLAALDAEGIPAADVGAVTEGTGLDVDGQDVDHPGFDPFWDAFAEYADVSQNRAG